MFLDFGYILIVLIPGMILSGFASMLVHSRFKKYSQVPNSRGITGAMAAKHLLDNAGIYDVQIVPAHGFLSDHYNPVEKKLALSPDVYSGTSIAAIGVATHEAGHAIQHKEQYWPLQVRSLVVPAAQFGSQLGYIGMFLGLVLLSTSMFGLGKIIFIAGVVLFSCLLLFQLITLPVEFDATARAKNLVLETGLVTPQERTGMDKVLNAAALTYIAAFLTSLLTLLYFLWRSGLLGGRR